VPPTVPPTERVRAKLRRVGKGETSAEYRHAAVPNHAVPNHAVSPRSKRDLLHRRYGLADRDLRSVLRGVSDYIR
jgi:hypothetical protein